MRFIKKALAISFAVATMAGFTQAAAADSTYTCGASSDTATLNTCFRGINALTQNGRYFLQGYYNFQQYRVLFGAGMLADDSWVLEVFQQGATRATYVDKIKLDFANATSTYNPVTHMNNYTATAQIEASGITYVLSYNNDNTHDYRRICVTNPNLGCQDQ